MNEYEARIAVLESSVESALKRCTDLEARLAAFENPKVPIYVTDGSVVISDSDARTERVVVRCEATSGVHIWSVPWIDQGKELTITAVFPTGTASANVVDPDGTTIQTFTASGFLTITGYRDASGAMSVSSVAPIPA